MPIGPGRYDDLCAMVREQADADGVVLIVLNGTRGSGFAVQANGELASPVLADLLQHVAAEIRQATTQ